MTTPNIPALLTDLVHAKLDADGIRPCGLCQFINTLEAGVTRDTLKDAAAGTIGQKKLEAILQKHGVRDNDGKPVGRRTIVRHRKEEHQP